MTTEWNNIFKINGVYYVKKWLGNEITVADRE